MSDKNNSQEIYQVPDNLLARTHVNWQQYQTIYKKSLNDNENFWREMGQRLDWIKPFSKVKDVSYDLKDFRIKWYHDGELNVCHNCVDRHLPILGQKPAIVWEANNPAEPSKIITYAMLYNEVCKTSNILKKLGVKKGDRVTIYMPMIPEAVYAMLACARIGAIHSVVFAGFSPEALAGRIEDCASSLIITADEGLRGSGVVPLKGNVDEALAKCKARGITSVKKTLVVRRTGGNVSILKGQDEWYHEIYNMVDANCPCEPMNAEDPLFILYTSGSTGKPKGVLHTTGGYLVYAALTHHYVFDYHAGDIYWCTADIGWVTGHSYVVYGPLCNGAISLVFEGVPNYPDSSRVWQVVDKHKVNIFYTAPTAIRALMREGNDLVKKSSRQSLKLLGTVGEPINPEAWRWYYEVVGEKRSPVIDTWWQTETGATLIGVLPGAFPLKPGSATMPFFGVEPAILDDKGQELHGEARGNLCLKRSWPGQMRTVYGDHERFKQTYFSQFAGYYFTGDGAYRDKEGYYWITGRVDDVLNISGHRLGTAEIESALVLHAKVAEAAVVGFPHEVKGQGIYVFVTLKKGIELKDKKIQNELANELKQQVRKEISPIATPDIIQFTGAAGLPKTRSGKIMRRILRKIAENDITNLGDTSTLADPSVVDDLIRGRSL